MDPSLVETQELERDRELELEERERERERELEGDRERALEREQDAAILRDMADFLSDRAALCAEREKAAAALQRSEGASAYVEVRHVSFLLAFVAYLAFVQSRRDPVPVRTYLFFPFFSFFSWRG